MDIVYLYSSASGPTEIKYSLRSLEKHLSGIGKVFIVGDDPGIFKGIIHLQCDNLHKNNRARNIYEKIRMACLHPDISPSFLCSSDDYFLLKDFQADTFPYYHCGELSATIRQMSEKNYYKAHVRSTYVALTARNLPALNFNVHCPIIYDKQLFLDCMGSYDWNVSSGYVSKSLYANSLKIKGEFMQDFKIHTAKTKTAIYRALKPAPFFSTNEHSMNEAMLEVLEEMCPVHGCREK